MTEEFNLRELTRVDLQTINNWRNDPDIVTSLGAPYRYINIETDEEWFATYQRNRTHQVRLIIANSEDLPVGLINLIQIDWLVRSAELSIQIGEKAYWGKGLGKWATYKMVQHGFFNLNLNRIYLTVLPENQKAYKIYQKIGFREEGVLRKAVYKDGCYRDLILMALLRDEFQPIVGC